MSLPAGVSTFELLFGKTFDFEGTPLRTDLVITPSHELVWEATGDRLVPIKVSKDADEGEFGSVLLPHTDQAGFVDLAGNAITDWWYTVQSTDRKGRTAASGPKTRKVQAVTGQTSIDLDLIPINGTVGPVGSVALPGVLSVNGETGAVNIEAGTVGAVPLEQKGAAAGVAELDDAALVPADQIPMQAIADSEAVSNTIGSVVDTAIAPLTPIQVTNARALLIGDEKVKVMATGTAAAPTAMSSPPTVSESATADGALSVSVSVGLTSPLRWDAATLTGSTPRYYTLADNSGVAASLPASRLAFDTDADKFGLSFQARPSWKYRIWVDSVPVTSALQTFSLTSGAAFLFVDFGSYSTRPRRIEIEIECVASPVQVFSLRVKPLATVLAPSAMAAPAVALVGDSFGAGSSATDFTFGYPRILARRMGWGNFYGHFTSVGSTGLTAAPSSTVGNYASRLAGDVIPLNPALVIVQGSINDSANYATAGAAVISYVTTLRAALPDVIVIATGVIKPKTLSANEVSLNSALATAAATVGIPFVSLLGTINVFKGTGNSTTPTGDGNADRFMFNDGSHPNTAGHEAIAAALEPLMRLALRSVAG